jgi:hypothetical protein
MIKQIIVYPVYDKNRDNKIAQARHKLKIKFKLSLVGEELIYKDEKNKKLGYEIKKGLQC